MSPSCAAPSPSPSGGGAGGSLTLTHTRSCSHTPHTRTHTVLLTDCHVRCVFRCFGPQTKRLLARTHNTAHHHQSRRGSVTGQFAHSHTTTTTTTATVTKEPLLHFFSVVVVARIDFDCVSIVFPAPLWVATLVGRFLSFNVADLTAVDSGRQSVLIHSSTEQRCWSCFSSRGRFFAHTFVLFHALSAVQFFLPKLSLPLTILFSRSLALSA